MTIDDDPLEAWAKAWAKAPATPGATCPCCGQKIRAPKAPAALALDATLPKPQRKWPVGAFVAHWADGTETKVSGVPYKESDPAPFAFQAADRLRRLRVLKRHELRNDPRAWIMGPCRVRMLSPWWWDFFRRAELPPLVGLFNEEGEALL